MMAVAAFVRLRFLLQTPYPSGVDGYWYLLAARGAGQGAVPVVPWAIRGLQTIAGPVLALKLVAACGTALAVLPAWGVAARLTRSPLAATVAAALMATSAQSFFLGTEFVKQGVGLTLALACLWAALSGMPRRARSISVAALLVATALTHHLALAVAVLLLLPIVLPALVRRGWKQALPIAGVLVSAAAAAAWHERGLLGALFSAPHFSGAVLDVPGRSPLVLGHEVALAVVVALLALSLVRREEPFLPAAGLLALAILQALPWLDVTDDQGPAYRLRLCAHVAMAPLGAVLAARIGGRLRRAWRGPLLLGLLLGLLVGRPWSSSEGVVWPHPAMVESLERLAGSVPPETPVVVPERHVAFMAAWYAGMTIRLRPPAADAASDGYRLLPGAAIRPGLWAALDELRAHRPEGVVLPPVVHPMHPNGLVLMGERLFHLLLRRLPPDEERWYREWHIQ